MGTTKIRNLLAVSLTALLLVGCASDEPVDETDMGPDSGSMTTGEENMAPAEETIVQPQKPMIDPSTNRITIFDLGDAETLTGVFYFDFDQAIVKRSGHVELDKHASALMSERTLRVRLEGHADERGTREYNLALGERRANAVRAYLVAQGVSRSQIEVISYGEEKPQVMGNGESNWARNRRVEFSYR